MATYCSSVTEATVTSSAETLSIELVADEKKQRQGFAAQFTFIGDTDAPESATTDQRPPALLPPSGGLVVDATTTTQTGRQQFGGKPLKATD